MTFDRRASERNSAAIFAADAGLFILSLRQSWWWHAFGFEKLFLSTPALRSLLPDAPILEAAANSVDANGRICGQHEVPMNVRVLAGPMTMDGEKVLSSHLRQWSRAWMW